LREVRKVADLEAKIEKQGSNRLSLSNTFPARFLLRSTGLPVMVVLLCIIFAVIQPRFATFSNLQNVSRQASLLAIIATGQAFPIISGGFDISIGSQIAAVSIVFALVTKQLGIPLGIVAGILFGSILGTANGLIIARFHVSAFVVTLGMMSFARGLALIITDGQPVFGMPPGFRYIGNEYVGPIPIPAIIAIAVFIVAYFILSRTRIGRYMYAIGGNAEAARLSGINVSSYQMLAYTFCGFFAAIMAVVLSSRVDSGQPAIGGGAEMEAIAAVVIGGVALGGGQGSILNVIFGVIIISLLSNGLNLINVSSYLQLMTIGAVIAAAVVIDQLRHGKESIR
jgi:ribose transport system permease protein